MQTQQSEATKDDLAKQKAAAAAKAKAAALAKMKQRHSRSEAISSAMNDLAKKKQPPLRKQKPLH